MVRNAWLAAGFLGVLGCAFVAGSGSSATVSTSWVPTDLLKLARQRYPAYVRVTPIGFAGSEALWTARRLNAVPASRYNDGSLQHVFAWHDGITRDLGSFGRSDNTAVAVNNHGQIAVMRFSAPIGIPIPIAGHTLPIETPRAYMWQEGRFTALGSLGGPMTFAAAIDDRGDIVGSSETSRERFSSHAFLWQHGKMTDLGTLGGKTSSAEAINDHGQIVGTSQTDDGAPRGFLWQNGKMIDLGTLGRWSIEPVAINDHGQVLGRGIDRSTTNTRVYLWDKGKLTDLGVHVDPNAPLAINDAGQVIGTRADHSGFVWKQGKVIPLGTVAGQAATPTAIDERGQIAGGTKSAGFDSHAFVWQSGTQTALPAPGRLSSAPVAWIDRTGTQVLAVSYGAAGLRTRLLVWTRRGPGS